MTNKDIFKSTINWILFACAILIPYAIFKTNSFVMNELFDFFNLENYSFFNSGFYQVMEKLTIATKYILAILLFLSLICLGTTTDELVERLNIKSALGSYMAQGISIMCGLLLLIISTPLVIIAVFILLILVSLSLILNMRSK